MFFWVLFGLAIVGFALVFKVSALICSVLGSLRFPSAQFFACWTFPKDTWFLQIQPHSVFQPQGGKRHFFFKRASRLLVVSNATFFPCISRQERSYLWPAVPCRDSAVWCVKELILFFFFPFYNPED